MTLLAAFALPAEAGDRYAAEVNGEHVIVQYRNRVGLLPPSAASDIDRVSLAHVQRDAMFASIGNLRIDTGDPGFFTPAHCGTRTEHRLIVCMTPDWSLSLADQLDLLSFMTVPSAVFSRSARVQASVRAILAQMPDRLNGAHFGILPLVSCGFECERVLVVDK